MSPEGKPWTPGVELAVAVTLSQRKTAPGRRRTSVRPACLNRAICLRSREVRSSCLIQPQFTGTPLIRRQSAMHIATIKAVCDNEEIIWKQRAR